MTHLKQSLRLWLYRAAVAGSGLLPRPPRRRYRLAILKLDRLGDATLALGAIRRLVRDSGEAETLLIISPIAEPLLRQEFPRAAFLILPAFCHRYWPDFLLFLSRHGAELQALEVEKLACLRHPPSDYLHAIVRLVHPAQCHSTAWRQPWDSVAWSFPHPTWSAYPVSSESDCLELEAHRRVVESVLGSPVSLADIIPSLTSAIASAGTALLVCPIAGSPLRQYPPALLAAAIKEFLAITPLPLHFCLPPEADPVPWREALDSAGVPCAAWHRPPDFAALLTLLSEARAVLAPESAPAHLATALDKPGVFLLGGGHHGQLAPWSRSHRQHWLAQWQDCYHCRWVCPHAEAYCLTQITSTRVAAALLLACSESERH